MASAASTVMATEPDIGLEETQSPEDHVHASRAVIVRAPHENGIAFVDELQAAGLKKNPILQFLRKKTGKRITLRDIHNLVAKLKEARHGPTSVKKNWNAGLREFCTL
ncbi:hypothetical protein PC116_g8029 [Phytophthora cactorum]|nr:hypothetical protein PC116_g8029 [Phytophthora cactorum]